MHSGGVTSVTADINFKLQNTLYITVKSIDTRMAIEITALDESTFQWSQCLEVV